MQRKYPMLPISCHRCRVNALNRSAACAVHDAHFEVQTISFIELRTLRSNKAARGTDSIISIRKGLVVRGHLRHFPSSCSRLCQRHWAQHSLSRDKNDAKSVSSWIRFLYIQVTITTIINFQTPGAGSRRPSLGYSMTCVVH